MKTFFLFIVLCFSCFGEIFTSTYKIAPGDNLTKIARECGAAVSKIVEWNGIKDANSIKVGQVLRLEPAFILDKAVEAFCLQESSNNPNAIGDNGAAVGVLQLHIDKVLDWNKHHSKSEQMHYGEPKADGSGNWQDDRLDREKSIALFKWWMTWKGAKSIDDCTKWWNRGAVGNKYGKKYIVRYRSLF